MPNIKSFKTKQEYLAWYKKYQDSDKIREYKRKYNQKWREINGYHNERNSNKRYPEKLYARRLLNLAIRSGKIKRLPCYICGKEKSQAHHEDYFKPLDIIWLCSKHHAIRHK